MFLSSRNSQNADSREININPTIIYSICCYRGVTKVSRSTEWDSRDRVTSGLKDEEDVVMCRYPRQMERREKRNEDRYGIFGVGEDMYG